MNSLISRFTPYDFSSKFEQEGDLGEKFVKEGDLCLPCERLSQSGRLPPKKGVSHLKWEGLQICHYTCFNLIFQGELVTDYTWIGLIFQGEPVTDYTWIGFIFQ